MPELGSLVLLFTLVAATYAAVASVAGARTGQARLVVSGRLSVYVVFGLLLLASSVLIYSFITHDFRIKYVQHYSDRTMPVVYLITAFWGGQDGSLLFWTLLVGTYATLVTWRSQEHHRTQLPYIIATMMTVVTFFLLLIILNANPFETFLSSAPTDGRGLQPLLQNEYMAIHPPMLYTGFTGWTVPFAFAISALCSGRLDEDWIRATRRWALFAWTANTVGLILGGLWAYEELGWGGYWAWDPVENASFMPWLCGTAYLHSVMIQERRGMLKTWNLSLIVLTFSMTIFGTFLTRSGFIQSVHSFAQSNIGYYFLAFLFFEMAVAFSLIYSRRRMLRGKNVLDSYFSREFAFLLNNWILLGACFFIIVATLFPTLSEWVKGEKITVGPEFFNKYMVPIGLILLALTGIGPLIAWRKATTENLKQQFSWPLASGIVTAAVCRGAFGVTHVVALISLGLCGMVTGTIVQEFYRGARVRQRNSQTDFLSALVALVQKGKRRYGGYIIHLGVVLMFLGFTGDAFKLEKEVTLRPGQEMQVGGYTFKYRGLKSSRDWQIEAVVADVALYQGSKKVADLKPAKWTYKKHPDSPTTEVDILSTPRNDVYTTLGGFEWSSGVANLKVFINPLVFWIWAGTALLIIGGVITMWPDRRLSA
jgi:cytochrome c-type biogenesis protein CcmF